MSSYNRSFRKNSIFGYKNRNISATLTRKYRYDKNEVAPIFWRITFNRKFKHYFSGFEFSKDEWDEFIDRDLRKHKTIKSTLEHYLSLTLKPAIDELVESNSFSFEALENLLNNPQKISVNEAFQAKIDSLEKEFKIGNASIYKNSINALMRFKHYKQLKKSEDKEDYILECINKRHITVGGNALKISETISFDEITPKFLNDCEEFWQVIGVSPATASIYMRSLRAIINNREGTEPFLKSAKYPFGVQRGKYVIPVGGRRDISLPIEDIWKIENYVTDNDALATTRDIFIFMFYCNGLNFGDLCRLRYENVDAASEEIIFQRKKTLRKGEKPIFIYAPILPPMVEIINRQGNKNQEGYIFPFLNGIAPTTNNERKIKEAINLALNPINSLLKVIANNLELDPEISTSYTRNSYITHLTSEMYVNPIVVRKMVGHSTKKDVTAGYVNLTAKKRREINEKLLNPDKKYSTINSGKVGLGK